ncbi:hypothetical protein [Streptomyces rochei]|uniref:hypothetical protein n=1 Tax=Streptomyces rochei TaxID=1928 RepID=UPI0038FCC866
MTGWSAVRLRPLLAHPAAGVRARAVAGLRALDGADAEQIRQLLDDPAAEVVRETATALLFSAKGLPADRLLERTSGRGTSASAPSGCSTHAAA